MATTVGFSTVWTRIERHAGEPFHQIRGGEFTYEVRFGCGVADRTNRPLPRAHFERAFTLVPLPSTAPLQRLQALRDPHE